MRAFEARKKPLHGSAEPCDTGHLCPKNLRNWSYFPSLIAVPGQRNDKNSRSCPAGRGLPVDLARSGAGTGVDASRRKWGAKRFPVRSKCRRAFGGNRTRRGTCPRVVASRRAQLRGLVGWFVVTCFLSWACGKTPVCRDGSSVGGIPWLRPRLRSGGSIHPFPFFRG